MQNLSNIKVPENLEFIHADIRTDMPKLTRACLTPRYESVERDIQAEIGFN
jgi:hypothetical protein